jgi:biopolymer transport protein ExbB
MLGSIWGLFEDGGLLMLPIAGCSVVLMVFVFERTYVLRRRRVIPMPFVTRLLHQLREDQLDADEALALCEDNGSVIAQVFAAAVKKWNRPSVEVEQAILDAGEREAYSLRKYLRLFNGISTITPLLGLLGTVVGMIQCFDAISGSNAMGRPELLAAGIGKALLTTAGGLFVAIPALMAYLYFTSRVDKLVVDIDRLGQELVAVVASDGWRDKGKADPRTRKVAKAA